MIQFIIVISFFIIPTNDYPFTVSIASHVYVILVKRDIGILIRKRSAKNAYMAVLMQV